MRTVVSRLQLPVSIPVFPTCTIWLMLDRFQVPAVWQAVVWTLWGLLFLSIVLYAFKEQPQKVVFEKEDSHG